MIPIDSDVFLGVNGKLLRHLENERKLKKSHDFTLYTICRGFRVACQIFPSTQKLFWAIQHAPKLSKKTSEVDGANQEYRLPKDGVHL